MSTVQRIAKNAAVLYGAWIVGAILSLVLTVFVARILGDAIYGKYTFALVFTGLFGILTNLGMNELLIREVARDKSKASKYLSNVAILRIILSTIVLVLIATTINLMNYPPDTVTAVYIFGGYTVITSLAAIFRVTFRAFERMEYEAGINALERIITTSSGLLVLFLGFGLVELAYVFLAASVVNLILSFLICAKRFAKPKLEVDLDFWKESLKVAFPFMLSNIFVMIYVRIDTVMLSVMVGDAAVGWYNAAYNLVLAFEPIVFVFMTAVFPVMSRFFISSEESLKVTYEKSFKYLIILGLPISVGGMILAHRIIPFLFGVEFANSIIALQILIWDCLLLSMYRPILYMLGSINRQGTMALIGGIGALINVGLNFLLIPRFSYVGAGVTTLITESMVTVASWYAISRYFYRLPIHKIMAKPLIASIAMGVIIYICSQTTSLNLGLLIVLGAALYFAILYLIRAFSSEDIALFKQAARINQRKP
jgi:O-antigen/teichoic acid export membrane protein